MMDDHSTWTDGGNGVEAGLMELNNLMSSGRFKVFDNLFEVFEEVRDYHRKQTPNGLSQIVKIKDDLIDAIRYAYMSARFAEQKGLLDNPEDEYEEPRQATNSMGY